MRKTKINKAIAIASIAALAVTSIGSAGITYAGQIGTGSVVGTGAFDSVINFDDVDTASGTVSDILIKAKVLPTLNMEISTGSIDLGTLTPGTPESGSLGIEIGTNSLGGVVITARSGSGGLTNTNNGAKIGNTGGELYKFSSVDAVTHDSSAGLFSSTGDLPYTSADNILEHPIYTTDNTEATNNGEADVTFTVQAQANAETPAGDYQDNITFTVTGNF